jgi:hypothetical protein
LLSIEGIVIDPTIKGAGSREEEDGGTLVRGRVGEEEEEGTRRVGEWGKN